MLGPLFDLGIKFVCRELIKSGKDIESAYWELVIKDIQDASKLFEPIYDQTDAGDGYVSVEVSPRLADDTEGTIEAAKWLHKVVNRPNVYIKIPATAPCIPSIKETIANGISVNVTVSHLLYTIYIGYQINLLWKQIAQIAFDNLAPMYY